MASNEGLYEQILATMERRYRKRQYMLIAGLFVLGLVVVYLGWRNYRAETVITMSQEQAKTSAGVEIAAEAAQIPLTEAQVQEVAKEIRTVAEKAPADVVKTTGQDLGKNVERIRKVTGSDFSIITNPDKPLEQPIFKPHEPVNLNVYNIKAYPKKMAEVSFGVHGADVAYLRRVDVPRVPLLLPKGTVGYVGPFVRTEYSGDRIDGGLRLVVTF